MKPARVTAKLAVAAVLSAAACGISTQGSPEALPGGVVTPAPIAAGGERPASRAPGARVFLVRDRCVVAVERTLAEPGLEATLRRLLEGPIEVEVAAGLRSAIPPLTGLRSVGQEGSTAMIDLTGAFVEVGGQEQILAVAQLVLTATSVPGVERARFALEGHGVEVPSAEGTLVPGPLSAADYVSARAECDR